MNDPLRDALMKLRNGEPVLRDGRWLLRAGVAFVFLWFGVDKFIHPGYWPMWVPEALPHLRTTTAIHAFGVLEVVLGVALLTGWRERDVSLAASLFLAAIIATSGLESVVRDVGLLAATVYLGLTSRSRAMAPLRLPTRRAGARWVAGGIVVLVATAAVAVGVAPMKLALAPSDGTGSGGDYLTITAPADDGTVAAGNVRVVVALGEDAQRLGVNHVHIKLDGQVVDAIYFSPDAGQVATTLKGVEEGGHSLTVYLAYADHVEHREATHTVAFFAES